MGLSLRWGRFCFFRLFILSLSILTTPQILWAQQGLLETPQPGSFQSGVGLIRGWVCSSNRVDVEVVGRGSLQAVYGEPRGDTQGICGDTNNGFSIQFNWNELGEGSHTVRVLADGEEFGRAQVVVATLGQAFLRGAQGEFTVSPFPQDRQQTHIRWQESGQSFVITNDPVGELSGCLGLYTFDKGRASSLRKWGPGEPLTHADKVERGRREDMLQVRLCAPNVSSSA
jgi:hypothetical protein